MNLLTQNAKMKKTSKENKAKIFNFSIPAYKTRSGKIMRRILRKIAEGDISNLGDTSTLADPSVVDSLVEDAL